MQEKAKIRSATDEKFFTHIADGYVFFSVSKEMSKDGLDESKISDPDKLIFFRNCMNAAEATPNTKPIPETDREKWMSFCGTLYVSNPYLAGSCRSEQSQIGVQKQNWCRNSKF